MHGVKPVHQSWSECVWCRSSTSKLIRMCMVWSQYIKADQNVYGVKPVHQSWSECVWCRASTSKLIRMCMVWSQYIKADHCPKGNNSCFSSFLTQKWHNPVVRLSPTLPYLPPSPAFAEGVCFFISFFFLSPSSHQSLVSYCAVCQTGIIYHVVYLKKGTFLWCLTFRLQ